MALHQPLLFIDNWLQQRHKGNQHIGDEGKNILFLKKIRSDIAP